MPHHAPCTLPPAADAHTPVRHPPGKPNPPPTAIFAEQTSSIAGNTKTARTDSCPTWIGTTRAKRFLGVGSERTIKAWVRYGYLRGRCLPNGRIQVLYSDVIRLSRQPPFPDPPVAGLSKPVVLDR